MTLTASAIQFKDVHLRTGVRLRYADIGPREGQPFVMLHGYTDSWFSFSRAAEHVPPDVRLIIPDQRGHGDSERPQAGYSTDVLATDAIALLDAAGIASATVVGHCMGGFVAQRMAILAPDRVGRLMLVACAPTACNGVITGFRADVQALTDPVDADFVRAFQTGTVFRPVPAPFMDRVVAESLKLPARVWKAVLAALLEMPVMNAGAIRAPTAVFWGDRDATFGRNEVEALVKLIPQAQLRVYQDVGHSPQWEIPSEFTRELFALGR